MSVVILPAYEPDEHLLQIVEELWECGKRIIVVDDGSGAACADLFEKTEDVSIVLHHTENRGKGAAIKTALAYIQQELWDETCIGVMDCDGQHTTTDMQKVLQMAELHPEALVLGCRMTDQQMPLKSRMGNQITRLVFKLVSGLWVSDTQTGLRAFSRQHIDILLAVEGDRYEYEMNVLLQFAREKVPVREVPIDTIYHDRKNSCSHFRVIRDSVRIYRKLLQFTMASFSSFLLDYLLFAGLIAVCPRTAEWMLAANILARFVSAFWNYTINSHLVFQTGARMQTAAAYILLAAGILCLNNAILTVLTQIVSCPVLQAKVLTEMTVFMVSWLVQSRWIFRKKKTVHGNIWESGANRA